MHRILVALSSALLFATSAAGAQVVSPPVAGSPAMLTRGTSVPLRTITPMTTEGKKLKVGQRFDVEVSEPVMMGDQIVIPVGTRGVGEITAIKNKGMWGQSGKIEGRVVYVRVNGREVRVNGTLDDKGSKGGVGAVGAALVFLPAGFFVTGTSATIPYGTTVMATLDEDLPITSGPSGPTPVASASATIVSK